MVCVKALGLLVVILSAEILDAQWFGWGRPRPRWGGGGGGYYRRRRFPFWQTGGIGSIPGAAYAGGFAAGSMLREALLGAGSVGGGSFPFGCSVDRLLNVICSANGTQTTEAASRATECLRCFTTNLPARSTWGIIQPTPNYEAARTCATTYLSTDLAQCALLLAQGTNPNVRPSEQSFYYCLRVRSASSDAAACLNSGNTDSIAFWQCIQNRRAGIGIPVPPAISSSVAPASSSAAPPVITSLAPVPPASSSAAPPVITSLAPVPPPSSSSVAPPSSSSVPPVPPAPPVPAFLRS